MLIYTNDDSVTNFWVERNSGTLNNLNNWNTAPRFDTAIVYVVGDNGTILRSPDRGIDWSPLASPTSRDLYGIDFANFTSPLHCGRFRTDIKINKLRN